MAKKWLAGDADERFWSAPGEWPQTRSQSTDGNDDVHSAIHLRLPNRTTIPICIARYSASMHLKQSVPE